MLWIESLLSSHGRYFKENSGTFAPELRAVQRAIDDIRENLKRMTEKNLYDLNYLLSKPVLAGKKTSNTLTLADVEPDDMAANGDENMADTAGGEEEWIGLE